MPSLSPSMWPIEPFVRAVAAVSALSSLARFERCFGLLVGESGAGKSTVIRTVAAAGFGKVFLSIPPAPVIKTTEFLRMIADAVGLQSSYYWSLAGFRDLQHSIRRWERLVIIVDEADRLNPSRLDLLRDLVDDSDATVLLCGLPKLERIVGRAEAVASRVAMRHYIPRVTEEDLAAVIGHGADFAKREGVRTWDDDVLAAVVEEARGNLRQVLVLLSLLEDALSKGMAGPGRLKAAVVGKIAREYLFAA